MKKKFLAAVVAGLMALSLTGCGSKNTETTQESDIIQNESESVKTTEDTTNGGSTEGTVEVTLADGNLQVALASLGDQVAFIDYDSNGTAMQVMLYKNADGTVHGALNTCQVCAGSPYAYFEQEGNEVVCQNCGNHFAVDAIGDVHGGCNPVPLEHSENGDQVLIDTSVLDGEAEAFANWKKGI